MGESGTDSGPGGIFDQGAGQTGADWLRQTRERIAHLNEDVKCFTANGRK